jgi:GMP synthase - Glutamine amidotransferase domain
VYEQGSPWVDPAIFHCGAAVLGICYGQHLMAHLLGGTVQKGDRGEYGPATLEFPTGRLFRGAKARNRSG